MKSKLGKYWFCDMRSKLVGKYWFCDMKSKLGKYWFCDMRSKLGKYQFYNMRRCTTVYSNENSPKPSELCVSFQTVSPLEKSWKCTLKWNTG